MTSCAEFQNETQTEIAHAYYSTSLREIFAETRLKLTIQSPGSKGLVINLCQSQKVDGSMRPHQATVFYFVYIFFYNPTSTIYICTSSNLMIAATGTRMVYLKQMNIDKYTKTGINHSMKYEICKP